MVDKEMYTKKKKWKKVHCLWAETSESLAYFCRFVYTVLNPVLSTLEKSSYEKPGLV